MVSEGEGRGRGGGLLGVDGVEERSEERSEGRVLLDQVLDGLEGCDRGIEEISNELGNCRRRRDGRVDRIVKSGLISSAVHRK